jgi:hypothetical protein
MIKQSAALLSFWTQFALKAGMAPGVEALGSGIGGDQPQKMPVNSLIENRNMVLYSNMWRLKNVQ